MSRYTLTLRQLLSSTDWHDRVEQAFKTYSLPRDEGGNRLNLLFDLFCATYDENEIGFETPALFVSELRHRSRIAVTKYGTKFYKRDDLLAMDYNTTNTIRESKWVENHHTLENTPNVTLHSSGHNSSEVENRAIENDNPEKNINIGTEFGQNNYATKLNHSKGGSSASSEGWSTQSGKSEDIEEHNSNHESREYTESGSYYSLDELKKLVSIGSLELDFIDEYQNLFMQIY